MKGLDEFYGRVEVMMKNMKRLIKTSNYEDGVFKPIIMKVGSQRRGNKGLMTMDTDIEMIARKIGLTLHDKIINELRPSMQSYIINTSFQKRFTMKIMETNLIFVKYEQVVAFPDSNPHVAISNPTKVEISADSNATLLEGNRTRQSRTQVTPCISVRYTSATKTDI